MDKIYDNLFVNIVISNKKVRKTYLEAKFQDSEGTLFHPTFKVLVNKVYLEFWNFASRYHFSTYKLFIYNQNDVP